MTTQTPDEIPAGVAQTGAVMNTAQDANEVRAAQMPLSPNEPPLDVPSRIQFTDVDPLTFNEADGGGKLAAVLSAQATARIEGDDSALFSVISIDTLHLTRSPDPDAQCRAELADPTNRRWTGPNQSPRCARAGYHHRLCLSRQAAEDLVQRESRGDRGRDFSADGGARSGDG
jgi:hypothetical protein